MSSKGEEAPMRDRRVRLALALAAVGLVAVGAVMVAGGSSNRSVSKVAVTRSDGDMRSALAKHLAQLGRRIPGMRAEPAGESTGNTPSSSSASLQQFAQMAYPKKDVPLSSIKAARAAFQNARARTPGNDQGNGNGSWEQVGPDTGLYQFTQFRTARSYVPREYAAAGRTTDLAIDPNCGSHHSNGHSSRCRMW